VARSTDVPAPIRSAANKRAIPRRPPADKSRLVKAAQAGILTDSNTKKNTRGRQAVDRATFLTRRSRRPEGATVRSVLGHESSEVRAQRQVSLLVDGPPRFAVLAGLARRDVSRAARYDALVSNLTQGRIAPRAFQRRVSSWRPIAGYTFLSDAEAVLAIVEARRAADEEVFVYRSGRAT
jgi:hypothetical protein